MKAPLRTVLILGILALLGVTALAWLAQRYRRMIPEPVSTPAPVQAEAPAESLPKTAMEPSDSAPSDPIPPEPPSPRGPSPEALDLVDRFVEVRSAVRAALDKYPYSKKVLAAEVEDEQTPYEKVPGSIDALAEIRVRRGVALEKAGLSAAEYDRIRTAWTRLREGKGEVDPELAPALEAKRAALEAVDLGRLEELDYRLVL